MSYQLSVVCACALVSCVMNVVVIWLDRSLAEAFRLADRYLCRSSGEHGDWTAKKFAVNLLVEAKTQRL